MTGKKHSANTIDLKALITEDQELMKVLMKEALQQVREAEMTDCVGIASSDRTQGRQSYHAGHYERGFVTRIGKLELRVPRDRNGQFETALFERHQRSPPAAE